MIELPNAIEAILFYHAEPMTVKRLSSVLKRPEKDIRDALLVLTERLAPTGLRLLTLGDEVTLGTTPDAGALIEAISKEELSKDLSKASLETLAIVLYRSPITRAEIDYIRGVNSTFILRNLLVRGLVDKVENPVNQRSFLYKPTFQLLQYMGVTAISELPEYAETLHALENFVSIRDSEDDTLKEELHAQAQKSETDAMVDSEMESFGIIPEQAIEDEMDADYAGEELSLPGDEVFSIHKDNSESENTISPEVEADIAEEDIAGDNFLDDEMTNHLRADESRT